MEPNTMPTLSKKSQNSKSATPQEGERQIECDIPAQNHARRGQRQNAVEG
jgi:hypothetical protein